MSGSASIRYHIDDLTLDTRLGTLYRDTQEIVLPQLSYRLLCELVSEAPAILSQEALMSRVWGDQVVGDETLKQRVKLLRQAIGDTPQSPRYIESVRGRGYRCVAKVEVEKVHSHYQGAHDGINLKLTDNLPVSLLKGTLHYWRLAALFLALTTLVIATTLAVRLSSQPDDSAKNAGDPSTETQARTQARAAYEKGRQFYLRYQSMDNEMAIKSFSRATELDPSYALAFAGLANAYSQGVFQFSGQHSWRQKALDAAYDAIMLDDTLAQSYKSLGNAQFVNGHLSQSLSADLKAVALAPSFIEAQASLGYIYSERGELKNAIERHIKVLALDVNYHVNWFHIALTLQRLGELDDAETWYRHFEHKQPDYHLATYHYSRLLLQAEKREQALALLLSAEKRAPDSLYVLKGLTDYFLLTDNKEQAEAWSHKLALLSNGENRQYAELLALLEDKTANRIPLQHWYQTHFKEYDETPFHSVLLAMAATGLTDEDGALRHLTEAVELGWLDNDYLTRQPYFEQLKADPRFARISQLIDRKRQHQKQQMMPLKIPDITQLADIKPK